MQKDNVNGALKVLTNNMTGGISPLTDETLQLLKLKHPGPKKHSFKRYYRQKTDENAPVRTKQSSTERWAAKDYSFLTFWSNNIRSS